MRDDPAASGDRAGRHRGVAAFVGLAFGLSWAAWAVGLRATGARGAALLTPRGQGVVLAGAFGPALAAWATRRWVTREGFADAGLAPALRRHWRRYALAVAIPSGAAAATVGLAAALRLARPDFSLARAQRALAIGEAGGGYRDFRALAGAMLLSTLGNTPLVWGEEFGWRGYLQPRLFPGRPALSAAATGLLWGVWHAPLVFAGYGLFGAGTARQGLLLYPLLCVPLSIVLGWLGGGGASVWLPSIGHAAHNSIAGATILMLFAGGGQIGRVATLLAVPYATLSAWIVRTGRLVAADGPRR